MTENQMKREMQRIVLLRYIRDNHVPASVGNEQASDDELTDEAQEVIGEFFQSHPGIKRRWQQELNSGVGDETIVRTMKAALWAVRSLHYFVKARWLLD